MPRGQSSTGHWNFHKKKYICPDCNRKGLYSTYTYAFHSGSYKEWICMYKNCPSRTNGYMFKKGNDVRVLNANPNLQ